MRAFILLASVVGMFWNLENFFDWKDGGTSESDTEFSVEGKRHWTKSEFYRKCNAVAKTVLAASDEAGGTPVFIGVAEVENAFVLSQICRATPLCKLGYSWVHFDSPDRRGIDCGLLYRRDAARLLSAKPCRIPDGKGKTMLTRDILVATFLLSDGDTLAVMVNHHPSKLGGNNDRRRFLAQERMVSIKDSLWSGGLRHIVAVGDFNDDVWSGNGRDGDDVRSCVDSTQKRKISGGTIKYNGVWEKIDGYFAWGLDVEETVFEFGPLLTVDKAYGGLKPLRTFSGPRYLGGVSDHLPIVLKIRF